MSVSHFLILFILHIKVPKLKTHRLIYIPKLIKNFSAVLRGKFDPNKQRSKDMRKSDESSAKLIFTDDYDEKVLFCYIKF